MAKGLNLVILTGNLGADPELRYTGNGTAVCNMRLCTPRRRKTGEGQYEDVSQWHSLTAWARLAEIAGEYAKKGMQLTVQGHIEYDTYEDKEGRERNKTEIVVRELILPTGRKVSVDDNGSPQPEPAGATQSSNSSEPDDDLPF